MNLYGSGNNFFKFLIYVFCCVSFFLNSYAIFKEYWSNPTIVSTKIEMSLDRKIDMPSILICNETGFKDSIVTTDYQKYKNNTINLNDFLIDVVVSYDTQKEVLNITLEPIRDNIKTIFTAFHGTCFLIEENIKVLNLYLYFRIELYYSFN